jgi:hypothetical protein
MRSIVSPRSSAPAAPPVPPPEPPWPPEPPAPDELLEVDDDVVDVVLDEALLVASKSLEVPPQAMSASGMVNM